MPASTDGNLRTETGAKGTKLAGNQVASTTTTTGAPGVAKTVTISKQTTTTKKTAAKKPWPASPAKP